MCRQLSGDQPRQSQISTQQSSYTHPTIQITASASPWVVLLSHLASFQVKHLSVPAVQTLAHYLSEENVQLWGQPL